MYLAKPNAAAALGPAKPIKNDTHPDKNAGNGPFDMGPHIARAHARRVEEVADETVKPFGFVCDSFDQ